MKNHIESLQIETYRGIKDLHVDNLGSVNVFVGDNNTGKTSVLEAIELMCNPNMYSLIQIARQRERFKPMVRMGLNILDSVLYMFDVKVCNRQVNEYRLSVGGCIQNETGKVMVTGKVIDELVDMTELAKHNPFVRNRLSHVVVEEQEEVPTLIGDINNTFKKCKQLTPFDASSNHFEINEYTRVMGDKEENSILNVKMIQTVDHLIDNSFDRLIKNRDTRKRAVELLKEFDENITDIRYINDDRNFIPVIENKEGDYIPLSLYGDGMKKALTMLNAIVSAENGVVLIDEFETALHTSAMSEVFKFILDVSKKLNVQLFLTTHSIEAVDKLLGSAGKDVNDIRIIRLRKKAGVTYAKVTNGADAIEGRKEYNMELRI